MKYYKLGEPVAIRKAFGEAFYQTAKKDSKLVVVTADLGGSLSLSQFWQAFPNRYFNCGVAEQNMIGITAGLAIQGFTPFAASFGSFLTRTLDHVRQSIGHNNLNVKIVGSHGGVSNAKDGPSAHALEDLAMFRTFPQMAVVVMADANQTLKALPAIAKHPTSVYLRLYREPLPVFTDKTTPFTIGKANILRPGTDISLIACGPQVGFCLEAADKLAKQSISAEVIDCHTLKPIDVKTITVSAKKTQTVITVEDHYIDGGLGSAVAEVLSENHPTPMKRIGLTDFSTTGDYHDVIKKVGIDTQAIIKATKKLLARKRKF